MSGSPPITSHQSDILEGLALPKAQACLQITQSEYLDLLQNQMVHNCQVPPTVKIVSIRYFQ